MYGLCFNGKVGLGVTFGLVACICLSLALTNLFLREGLALYTIIGGDGNICFRYGLFLISFQCLLKTLLILWMSSENCVTNTSFFGCVGFCFLVRAVFLSLNLIDVFDVVDYLGLFVSSLFQFVN